MGQRVAVHGEIGVDVARVLGGRVAGKVGRSRQRGRASRRAAQSGHEGEPRFFGLLKIGSEGLLHELFDFGRTATGRLVGRNPMQRRAIRLGAQLDSQEIILAERVGQVLGRHFQQRQELLGRQEVPVPPQHGDIAAGLPLGKDRALRRQPHRKRHRLDVPAGRAQHIRQLPRLHDGPIPPDQGVHAVGEVVHGHGRRGRHRPWIEDSDQRQDEGKKSKHGELPESQQ